MECWEKSDAMSDFMRRSGPPLGTTIQTKTLRYVMSMNNNELERWVEMFTSLPLMKPFNSNALNGKEFLSLQRSLHVPPPDTPSL